MGARENKVEKYLDTEVAKIGGITRKWVCPGRDGVPDRIVMLYSKVWFVEVKTDDGKLSPEQIREHERLREVGMQIRTVWGKTGVDYFIKEVMK